MFLSHTLVATTAALFTHLANAYCLLLSMLCYEPVFVTFGRVKSRSWYACIDMITPRHLVTDHLVKATSSIPVDMLKRNLHFRKK